VDSHKCNLLLTTPAPPVWRTAAWMSWGSAFAVVLLAATLTDRMDWPEGARQFHDLLRPLAWAMAGTHLADRRDVILPQYAGDLQQLQIFERVAHDAEADSIDIVLLDDRDAAIERFNSRDDDSEWTRHNNELVADLGGDEFLASMYDRLLAVLEARPDAVVVRSVRGAIDATAAALDRALTTVRALGVIRPASDFAVVYDRRRTVAGNAEAAYPQPPRMPGSR